MPADRHTTCYLPKHARDRWGERPVAERPKGTGRHPSGLSESQAEAAQGLYLAGWTLEALARIYGARVYDLKMPPRGVRHVGVRERGNIVRQYELGMSALAIARKHGLPEDAVLTLLRKGRCLDQEEED